MDAVNPWLDPSEVRHLAEQLLRPVAPAHLQASDPGFDVDFEGFTQQQKPAKTNLPAEAPAATSPLPPSLPPPPSETATARETPEIQTTPAEKPPQPPAAEHATFPLNPPDRPLKTRFMGRVQILREWLEKNFDATDVFILDKDGKVIFDDSGHGRLHFMARNLAFATRGPDVQNRNIHVKIGPAAILEVIPCETPYGRLVLGALVPAALPPGHIDTITEVLIQTASPA